MKNKLLQLWRAVLSPFLKDPLFLCKWERSYHSDDSNRISAQVNGHGYRWLGHNNYQGKLYMFVEDMHQGVMPFTSIRHEGQEFVAKLEPERLDEETLVTKSLNRAGYSRDLADGVSD